MPFHPSKQLGQNFLVNQGIIDKIITAADLSKDDTILEVGPGKGVLTEELVKRAGRVVAVEKDRRMYEMLSEKFKDAKNLELVNGDILHFDFKKSLRQAQAIFAERTFSPISPERSAAQSRGYIMNYKIVANIPYNITGAFFQKFLLGRSRPEMIVVMVQKEVGDKLLRRGGRTLLTLAAELYGKTEKICDVSPGSFRPAPKVASMVIKMVKLPSSLELRNSDFCHPREGGDPENKREGWIPAFAGMTPETSFVIQGSSPSAFPKGEEDLEQKIMRLARLGFVNKRKKLATNLSTGLKISKEKILRIFAAAGIGENARAEELNKDDWLKLAKSIGN